MTKLEQIEQKIKEFEDLQEKWSNCGAFDTEPSWNFQNIIRKAIHGEKKVLKTSADWELYSCNKSKTAAMELSRKANELVALILKTQIRESKEVIDYLKNYCWRVDI